MSDIAADPIILFKTRTNSELGAQQVTLTEGGDLRLVGVVKKVTESMLASYPRDMLGKWTPNRSALLYPRDEIAERKITRFDNGEALDVEGVLALAQ